jgi:hypothetical protein
MEKKQGSDYETKAAKLRTGNVPGIYHATIWICYLGAIDRYCPNVRRESGDRSGVRSCTVTGRAGPVRLWAACAV